MLPLTGIKVLDMTRILAGPLSAQMLGDLGAEVIKIERPGIGDDARSFGPPYLADADGKETNNNSAFICANRNKSSIAVNIASPAGREIVLELTKSADILMENFKVGDLRRHGLDYDSVKKINPGIIYCSVTGYGQSGPYRARPGYDAVFQAEAGLMSVTGHPDGVPGGGPMKAGPSIADVMTGMNASIGILAALFHRKVNGGQGQHIDVCLMDTTIASMTYDAQKYLISGEIPSRRGTLGGGGVPSRVFTCADQDIMLVCGNDAQFVKCCEVLGRPELAQDPRFVTNRDRIVHRSVLIAILEEIFITKPAKYWLGELEQAGVPAGSINNLQQVFADEHVKSRGMAVKTNHPLHENLSLVRNALLFSETPITEYRAPPLLGQHTREILRRDLGYSEEKIADLCRAGIIQQPEGMEVVA